MENYRVQYYMNSLHMRSQEEVMVDMIRQGNSEIVEDVSLFSVIMND